MDNRIIPTIGKHVIAQDALTSRNECISIDESAQLGIVITGLEVVERGLSVLWLSAMRSYAFDTHTKSYGISCGYY